jgi:hypothetical protein
MTRHDDPDDLQLVGLKLGEGPYSNSEFEKKGRGEMIDVEVVTKLNYTNRFKGRYVSVPFYFCDQVDMYVQGLGHLGLYRRDKRWVRIDDGQEGDDNSYGPYHYHTAMSSFAHDETPIFNNKPTILDYDLRRSPRDVCFYLDAGAMGLGIINSVRSNVVRIPKEVLIKFFAEHPRRPPSRN